MKVNETKSETLHTEDRTFAVKDNFGRAVGAHAMIVRTQYHEETNAQHAYWNRDNADDAIWLWVRALRAGKKYGPAFNRTEHKTVEAAHAAMEKYFAAAEKRARRNKKFTVTA